MNVSLFHPCGSESEDTLDEPGHRQAADEVRWGERCPRWKPQWRPTRGGREGHHRGDEQQLTRLYAYIEEEQRNRDVSGRQADLAQGAGNAEAVQEPERERDDSGRSRRDARVS